MTYLDEFIHYKNSVRKISTVLYSSIYFMGLINVTLERFVSQKVQISSITSMILHTIWWFHHNEHQ